MYSMRSFIISIYVSLMAIYWSGHGNVLKGIRINIIIMFMKIVIHI